MMTFVQVQTCEESHILLFMLWPCNTSTMYLTVPVLVLPFQLADQVLARRALNGNGTHNPLIMSQEHTPMHHSAPIPDCSSAGTPPSSLPIRFSADVY